jgi:hypothetical protein
VYLQGYCDNIVRPDLHICVRRVQACLTMASSQCKRSCTACLPIVEYQRFPWGLTWNDMNDLKWAFYERLWLAESPWLQATSFTCRIVAQHA